MKIRIEIDSEYLDEVTPKIIAKLLKDNITSNWEQENQIADMARSIYGPDGKIRVGESSLIPSDYSLENHGVENAQYWQGAGTSFSDWEECFTGIGDSPKEAAEDALEMAAQNGWSVDDIENDLSGVSDIPEHTDDCENGGVILKFVTYSGMTVPLYEGNDIEEAKEIAEKRIARAKALEQPVNELEDGRKWEFETPEDASLISDNDGILYLEEIQCDGECMEECELQHYVVLYVK